MEREAPGSWAHTVDRGLRLALSVPLLVSLAADLPRAILLFRTIDPVSLGGVIATLASMVLLLVLIYTRTETPARLWTAVGLLSLGQGWSLAEALRDGHPPVAWWPIGAAVVLVSCLVIWTSPDRRILVAGPAVVLLGLCRFGLMSLGGEPLLEALVEGVLMVEVAAAAAILADVLRDSARGTDRALAERRGARSQRAAASMYRDQLREVERFMHDEVVHALRAVAMDRSRIPAADARHAAADAWAKLKPEGEPPTHTTHDLMSALETMSSESACEVELKGGAPPLPPDVVEALTLATAEAVRNVQLHAGAARAYIAVAKQGRGVVVSVTDHGPGFDPDTTRLRGSQSSILERMEGVGGSAEVTSGPSGTRVNVGWEPRIPDTYVGTDVPARLSLAAIPLLIGTFIVAILLAPAVALPWLGLLATGIATLMGLWAIRRMQSRRLSSLDRAALIAAALVSVVLNVLSVAPDDTRGLHLWLVNGVTPLVLILIVSTTFAWGIAIVATVSVTGVVAAFLHFGMSSTFVHFSQVLIIPSAWLGILAMQFMIDRLSGRAMDAWEAATRSDSHAHHLAARAEISERRLARIREEIGPFLRAVGTGALSPEDPKTQLDAAVLEALVRDDIRFGGGSPAFRRQLTLLRRGGWDVDVRMTSNAVRATGGVLLALVKGLPESAPHASLVLTSTSDQLVAILSGLDTSTATAVAHEWESAGGKILSTPEFVRLTIALSAEKPAQDSPGHTGATGELSNL